MNFHFRTTPSAEELLLPWYASGALSAPQVRQIDAAVDQGAAVARQFAVVDAERAAIISLNESLDAPSPNALLALFTAIDADDSNRDKSRWRL